jgi:predicted MFS family arabinose efflux permease
VSLHHEKSGTALISSYLVLNITTGIVGGAMQMAVPCFALSLGASTSEIGIIRGISGLGMLLLVIPAGFLVDHVGSKRLFLFGAFTGTLVTFSLLFARTPVVMVVIMGLSGLFQSLKMTALNASFYSNIHKIGIDKSGWFKGSMSIGLTFIGPVLGGLLVDHLSYRFIFPIIAALTLIPIILVYVFHDDQKQIPTNDDLITVTKKQLGDFRVLIGNRSLYLPLLTEMFSTGCFALFATFIIVIAVRILHLPTTVTSLLLTIEGGVFIVTVFAAGPLLTVLSQFYLYLISIMLTIAGLLALTIANSFSPMVAATVVLGLGLGFLNLVTSSRLALLPGDKGKTVGLFSAAVGVGISIGPILGGFVAAHFGSKAAFLTFVPLFLMLLGVAALQARTDKRAKQQSSIETECIADVEIESRAV